MLPGPLGLGLQAALVKGEGLLAFQLQALRRHGLVAGLAGAVMPPAQLDPPAESLHHRAVPRPHELRHGAGGQNHEPRTGNDGEEEENTGRGATGAAPHSTMPGAEGPPAVLSPNCPCLASASSAAATTPRHCPGRGAPSCCRGAVSHASRIRPCNRQQTSRAPSSGPEAPKPPASHCYLCLAAAILKLFYTTTPRFESKPSSEGADFPRWWLTS